MIGLGWLIFWYLYNFTPELLSYGSYFILFMMYVTMLICGSIVSKSTQLGTIHQTLGFHKIAFKFVLLAVAYAAFIWVGDYYFQTMVMHIDMLQTAETWYSKQSNMLLVFISTAVLTPVIEEILFRGILFDGIKAHLPPMWSALILSILFTFIHFNHAQILSLFVASMIYYHITQKSKSIVPAIIAHIINNTMTFLHYTHLINQ